MILPRAAAAGPQPSTCWLGLWALGLMGNDPLTRSRKDIRTVASPRNQIATSLSLLGEK